MTPFATLLKRVDRPDGTFVSLTETHEGFWVGHYNPADGNDTKAVLFEDRSATLDAARAVANTYIATLPTG